jgi:hypothetical protein
MSRPGFLDALVRSEPVRVFQILLGMALLPVAAIIGLISPAPIGIVVAGAGIALVLRNSRWARRRYMFYARRHPRVRRAVDLGLMRGRQRRRRQQARASIPAPYRAPAAAGTGGDSLTKPVSEPTSPAMSQAPPPVHPA